MTVGFQRSILAATFGGEGWSPRTRTLGQEMGTLWGDWGQNLEWASLKAVLLHRPGPEVEDLTDPDAVQMLDTIDVEQFRREHDAMAEAYRNAGVKVYYLEPGEPVYHTPSSLTMAANQPPPAAAQSTPPPSAPPPSPEQMEAIAGSIAMAIFGALNGSGLAQQIDQQSAQQPPAANDPAAPPPTDETTELPTAPPPPTSAKPGDYAINAITPDESGALTGQLDLSDPGLDSRLLVGLLRPLPPRAADEESPVRRASRPGRCGARLGRRLRRSSAWLAFPSNPLP